MHPGLPSEGEESCVAVFLEVVEVLGASSAHCLHHLLTQLHGRGQGLRISTQDVAEVYVEQFA